MATLRVWWFGSRLPVELQDDGEIDTQAIEAFTCGHCHSLALALHELTGWPLYGLYSARELDEDDTPGHVVVRSPKYGYVDINGAGAMSRWARTFGRITPLPLTVDEVHALAKRNYMRPEVEIARPFAVEVLHKHCLDVVRNKTAIKAKRTRRNTALAAAA